MPKIPTAKIPDLVARHDNGESFRELATEFNVSHMTVKRAIENYEAPPEFEAPPEPPDVFKGFKIFEKVILCRDVDFEFYYLKISEVVKIVNFLKPENTAIVTTDRYGVAFDVPIDTLQKL